MGKRKQQVPVRRSTDDDVSSNIDQTLSRSGVSSIGVEALGFRRRRIQDDDEDDESIIETGEKNSADENVFEGDDGYDKSGNVSSVIESVEERSSFVPPSGLVEGVKLVLEDAVKETDSSMLPTIIRPSQKYRKMILRLILSEDDAGNKSETEVGSKDDNSNKNSRSADKIQGGDDSEGVKLENNLELRVATVTEAMEISGHELCELLIFKQSHDSLGGCSSHQRNEVSLCKCLLSKSCEIKLSHMNEGNSSVVWAYATYVVQLHLTEQAFHYGSPHEISSQLLGTNCEYKQSLRIRRACSLRHALGAIFSKSLLSHISMNPSGSEAVPIRARDVYYLVDNVNIREARALSSLPNENIELAIPGLQPTLREYQALAVNWMISRETTEASIPSWQLLWVVITANSITSLSDFRKSSSFSSDSFAIFFNPFHCWLCTTYDEAKLSTELEANIKGGILADSMGLGKTVEVLGCILSNPRPLDDIDNTSHEKILSSEQILNGSELCAINTDQADASSPREKLCLNTVVNVKRIVTKYMRVEGGLGRIIKIQPNSDRHSHHKFAYDIKFIMGGSVEQLNREAFDFHPTGDQSSAVAQLPEKPYENLCFCRRKISSAKKLCTKDISRQTQVDYLGWVQCRACKEYMHASCAGYRSLDELPASLICSSHRCPSCNVEIYKNSPIKSKATLIVTPPAILEQWKREIQRHSTGALKVIFYPGVKSLSDPLNVQGACNRLLLHSHELADADIVLTTFSILRDDLSHTDNVYVLDPLQAKRLRTKKRYRVIPSPLINIEWWRICLDEAQRVEGTASAAAKMASRLLSYNKWCVTGTPFGRGHLEDLYGLLLFLNATPFCDKRIFRHCLHSNHTGYESRIQSILQPLLWRSTKADPVVCKQIGIPEQFEKKVKLTFSSVERHFYKRQLENTIVAADEVSSKQNKKTLAGVTSCLHSLRAACCHPQVGISGIQRLGSNHGISTHVLTMDQILDKLIEDARTKSEESQRVAVMHSNAIAGLMRLKIEAKKIPNAPKFAQSDDELLNASAKLYNEALALTGKNASPSDIIGDTAVVGCRQFEHISDKVRNGSCEVSWSLSRLNDFPWVKFEFQSPKKISALEVRPILGKYNAAECILQVSVSSLGGTFVDVCKVSIPLKDHKAGNWLSFSGFRSRRSRVWRILVVDRYSEEEYDGTRMSLGVKLMEPYMSADDLQRLHILYNLSVVQDILSNEPGNDPETRKDNFPTVKEKNDEISCLENKYMEAAISGHRASALQLSQASKTRSIYLARLSDPNDLHSWWKDLLSWLQINVGNLDASSIMNQHVNNLCAAIRNNVSEVATASELPPFVGVAGLLAALHMRCGSTLRDRKCIDKIALLDPSPSNSEIVENTSCRKCRADWHQTGPVCRHCKLEEVTLQYEEALEDKTLFCMMNTLLRWLDEDRLVSLGGDHIPTINYLKEIKRNGENCMKLFEAEKKELTLAKRHWRMHFDLLSDIDEMNQCKSTLRLVRPGENISDTPDELRHALVMPCDIQVLMMDHEVRQGSAAAALRRDMAVLRYLRNQQIERHDADISKKIVDEPTCPVCLSKFGVDDRAVLRCGHSLHSTCLEQLVKRMGGRSIRCPLKCVMTTSRSDVLLATDSLVTNDGSKICRTIVGSWGTKVDRLIVDILNVIDDNEKCVVFSQWNDLLTIVESALEANSICFTHPVGQRMFGKCLEQLRSHCSVMLLNVKNGAEGLTLIEANHVFMIEPLLHSGLDSQAINRVHRIGQRRQTYVHRYIIENTIEEKIDNMRMERQSTYENDEEGNYALKSATRRDKISAGGLDGGFTANELESVLSNL